MKPRAWWLAGVAGLIPAPVQPAAPVSLAAASFQPPSVPLLLSRRLVRDLPGGKSITTVRTYRVAFVREAEGWRLDGELRSVTVEAPPVLESLAAVERARADHQMFPLHLDALGRILPRPIGHDARARDRTVAAGRAMIAATKSDAAAKADADKMLVEVVSASAAGSAWPSDLFNPSAPARVERRSLSLPQGIAGTVEIALRARTARPGVLPQSVERTVTTQIAGTTRVSREVWTIEVEHP